MKQKEENNDKNELNKKIENSDLNKGEVLLFKYAKEMILIIYEVTEKSPKKYRYDLVKRIRDISLNILEEVFLANSVFLDSNYIKDINTSINIIKQNDNTNLNLNNVNNDKDKNILNELKTFILKCIKGHEGNEILQKRINHEKLAIVYLNELDYLLTIARDLTCITNRQSERIAEKIFNVKKCLYSFSKVDFNRDYKKIGKNNIIK